MGTFNNIATSGSGIVLAQEYQNYRDIKSQSRRSSTNSEASRSSQQELSHVGGDLRTAYKGLGLLGSATNRQVL